MLVCPKRELKIPGHARMQESFPEREGGVKGINVLAGGPRPILDNASVNLMFKFHRGGKEIRSAQARPNHRISYKKFGIDSNLAF